MPGALQHFFPVPHLVGLHQEIEQALDATGFRFDAFLQPRPGRAAGASRLGVNAFDLFVREHFDKVLLLELVGLPTLLDLAQEPSAVLKLKSPELLERRRRAIAAEEFLIPVVDIIIPRPR